MSYKYFPLLKTQENIAYKKYECPCFSLVMTTGLSCGLNKKGFDLMVFELKRYFALFLCLISFNSISTQVHVAQFRLQNCNSTTTSKPTVDKLSKNVNSKSQSKLQISLQL